MPVYTYRCQNCSHEFDRQQSFQDKPLKVCPECHKHSLQKVYRPAGVVFKGSGFYVTDKSRKAAQPAPSNGAKKAKEGSGETKTEAKSEKSTPKPKSED